jgi:hypothetical protein
MFFFRLQQSVATSSTTKTVGIVLGVAFGCACIVGAIIGTVISLTGSKRKRWNFDIRNCI